MLLDRTADPVAITYGIYYQTRARAVTCCVNLRYLALQAFNKGSIRLKRQGRDDAIGRECTVVTFRCENHQAFFIYFYILLNSADQGDSFFTEPGEKLELQVVNHPLTEGFSGINDSDLPTAFDQEFRQFTALDSATDYDYPFPDRHPQPGEPIDGARPQEPQEELELTVQMPGFYYLTVVDARNRRDGWNSSSGQYHHIRFQGSDGLGISLLSQPDFNSVFFVVSADSGLSPKDLHFETFNNSS